MAAQHHDRGLAQAAAPPSAGRSRCGGTSAGRAAASATAGARRAAMSAARAAPQHRRQERPRAPRSRRPHVGTRKDQVGEIEEPRVFATPSCAQGSCLFPHPDRHAEDRDHRGKQQVVQADLDIGIAQCLQQPRSRSASSATIRLMTMPHEEGGEWRRRSAARPSPCPATARSRRSRNCPRPGWTGHRRRARHRGRAAYQSASITFSGHRVGADRERQVIERALHVEAGRDAGLGHPQYAVALVVGHQRAGTRSCR